MSDKVVYNVYAKTLADRKYSQRIIKSKKGMSSYKRIKVKCNDVLGAY